jgi:hypothetical protein
MNPERDNLSTREREVSTDDRRQAPILPPGVSPPSTNPSKPSNSRAEEYLDILLRARNG